MSDGTASHSEEIGRRTIQFEDKTIKTSMYVSHESDLKHSRPRQENW